MEAHLQFDSKQGVGDAADQTGQRGGVAMRRPVSRHETEGSVLLEMRSVAFADDQVFPAVADVDIEVHRGEAVVLVGAARSTILHLMSGQLKANKGTISRFADGAEKHTVALPPEAAGHDSREVRHAVVAATRAWPNVVLADDPFANVTEAEAASVLADLVAYRSERSAVVIATDRPEVIAMCSRTIDADAYLDVAEFAAAHVRALPASPRRLVSSGPSNSR